MTCGHEGVRYLSEFLAQQGPLHHNGASREPVIHAF